MLYQWIEQSQKKEEQALFSLLHKFSPLLKKYAYWLHTEDAYEDLQCDFIQLINAIDLSAFHRRDDSVFVSYIAKSMHSFYVKRLGGKINDENSTVISSLKDNQRYFLDQKLSFSEEMPAELLESMRQLLTEKEYRVLYGIYYAQISVTDLADKLCQSRQNINQIKRRALSKLKKHMR